MIETKVFFEDGRTIIVIENPTKEQNDMIKNAFCDAAVQQVANLLAVQKAAEAAPEPEKKPEISAKTEAAKALLKNPQRQKELGLEETVKILLDATGENADTGKMNKQTLVQLWGRLKKQILG